MLHKLSIMKITKRNNLKNREVSYAGNIMKNTSGHCGTLQMETAQEEKGDHDEHGSTI